MVGGNQIHQFLDLLRPLRGFENGAVIIVGFQAQHAEALLQAVRQQRLFVSTQPDAAVLVNQVNQNPVRLAGKGDRHKKRPIDCCVTGELSSEVSKITVVRVGLGCMIVGHRDRAAPSAGNGGSRLREEPRRRHRPRADGIGLAADEQAQFRHQIFQGFACASSFPPGASSALAELLWETLSIWAMAALICSIPRACSGQGSNFRQARR
jgi:hypothetical protein